VSETERTIGSGGKLNWKTGMAKTRISNADLVSVFTEKLKSFRDEALSISIAIVPTKDSWKSVRRCRAGCRS
jgi:hypothetical protein